MNKECHVDLTTTNRTTQQVRFRPCKTLTYFGDLSEVLEIELYLICPFSLIAISFPFVTVVLMFELLRNILYSRKGFM